MYRSIESIHAVTVSSNLHFLLGQTSRQGLDQLLGLLLVRDLQGVQVLATSDLELGVARGLLDANNLGILAVNKQANSKQENDTRIRTSISESDNIDTIHDNVPVSLAHEVSDVADFLGLQTNSQQSTKSKAHGVSNQLSQ